MRARTPRCICAGNKYSGRCSRSAKNGGEGERDWTSHWHRKPHGLLVRGSEVSIVLTVRTVYVFVGVCGAPV